MPQKEKHPSLFDNYILNTESLLYKLFFELESRIKIETDILKGKKSLSEQSFFAITLDYKFKILLINKQLHLIKRSLFIKEHYEEYIHLIDNKQKDDVNLLELIYTDFNSIDDLIDFKTTSWDESSQSFKQNQNIRSALNASRLVAISTGIVFIPEVLWGKSNTLDRFEESLENEPHFDLEQYKYKKKNAFNNPVKEWDDFIYSLNSHKKDTINFTIDPTPFGPI